MLSAFKPFDMLPCDEKPRRAMTDEEIEAETLSPEELEDSVAGYEKLIRGWKKGNEGTGCLF